MDRVTLTYYFMRFLRYYQYVIFARVIASWIFQGRNHPIYDLLIRFTEPILGPIRSLVGRLGGGMLDFSPIIAYFLLSLMITFLQHSIG